MFFYFAGHGNLESRRFETFQLLPSDASPKQSGDDNWIDGSDWHPLLEQSNAAKHMLSAFGCCHAGAALKGTGDESSDTPLGYVERTDLTLRARWILVSTLESGPASDGPRGSHSPFASGFLAALELCKPDRPVFLDDLLSSVRTSIQRAGVGQAPRMKQVDEPKTFAQFMFLSPPR